MGKIPWIDYWSRRGVINGSGKNKSDLGMGGVKNKKKGYCHGASYMQVNNAEGRKMID